MIIYRSRFQKKYTITLEQAIDIAKGLYRSISMRDRVDIVNNRFKGIEFKEKDLI